jgi:hypothetical protein
MITFCSEIFQHNLFEHWQTIRHYTFYHANACIHVKFFIVLDLICSLQLVERFNVKTFRKKSQETAADIFNYNLAEKTTSQIITGSFICNSRPQNAIKMTKRSSQHVAVQCWNRSHKRCNINKIPNVDKTSHKTSIVYKN